MAPVKLKCGDGNCLWESHELEYEQALPLVTQHMQYMHPVAQQPPQHHGQYQSLKGKMDTPVLKSGIDEAEYSTWLYNWENYKVVTGISAGLTSAQLYACMDEDLKNDVQKYNPEVNAKNMTEADLLSMVRRLAVKEESKLAHRIKMGRLQQPPGTSVRTFHANLKGTAAHCQYQVTHHCTCGKDNRVDYSDEVIQDQLVKGLADQEILADLLGDEKADRTTMQIVEFIARKEQAKQERGTVSCESTTAVWNQAQMPAINRICRNCKGPDHGSGKQRRKVCPARSSVCHKMANVWTSLIGQYFKYIILNCYIIDNSNFS